jgi:hypothetical protein
MRRKYRVECISLRRLQFFCDNDIFWEKDGHGVGFWIEMACGIEEAFDPLLQFCEVLSLESKELEVGRLRTLTS